MNGSSSEGSASSTGSGSPSPDRRPKEQAPSDAKAPEAKVAGQETDSDENEASGDEEEKEEEDEEEDPEEEDKESEKEGNSDKDESKAQDPDESSDDSSAPAPQPKEDTKVRLVPATRPRSRSRSSAKAKKDRSKRSRSKKKDRSSSQKKRRSSTSQSRRRKSPKHAARGRPVPSNRARSRSKSAKRMKDRNKRSKSRKKDRASGNRKRRSSSSHSRQKRSSVSKPGLKTDKAVRDQAGKSAPLAAIAPEGSKEGAGKQAQTPALSAAEELRQALFGSTAKPSPEPAAQPKQPTPPPKLSFGLPKKPQLVDWRRRSAAETKPVQQVPGAVGGSDFTLRAHAGELAAAVAAAQALHNPRNREVSRKIATLLEQCPVISDDALTSLRALPSDQVVQVLQSLASRRSEISDPSVWVMHVVNRLAVAEFNTAQGVQIPSTMVTEMLNRHLPKLATAAKSLLLQIPEVDAIKIIQDHLTYRGDASDSVFQAATAHIQQGIAASACNMAYPMTMDAFGMGCMGCGMMPMAMPGCCGAMMPGQMPAMGGCGMMGCTWGGVPCAASGETAGTGAAGAVSAATGAAAATAVADAPAAPAAPPAPAEAVPDAISDPPHSNEAAPFAPSAELTLDNEDKLAAEEVVNALSSLAGVAPMAKEWSNEA